MFSLRDGCTIALLLAAVQSLAFASLKTDEKNRMNLAKLLVTSMNAPVIDRIESVIRDFDSTSPCAAELSALVAAFADGETWAIESRNTLIGCLEPTEAESFDFANILLDASSKIQSGILDGNLRDLGMYGQCIRSSGQYHNTDVQGRHCTVTFKASYEGNSTDIGDASIALTSSICVPSSCNASEIAAIARTAYEEFSEMFDFPLTLNVTASSCARIESEDFTLGEIFTIVFFALVAFFLLFSTICDFVKRSKLTNVNCTIDTLAKFSLWTNAKIILSTKITPGLMPALQGMRFLCMCWIILGHRYFSALFKPNVNLGHLPEWANTWEAVYIQTAPFAVDTFFVISGFLMTYHYLKTLQSGRRLSVPMMFIHRYLRLTPAIAVTMLFVVFLLHRVANGPIWNTVSTLVIANCQRNWWVNLLYVQNFVNQRQLCLGHGWYLAVDMQLFWISPIVLYPMYRWPKYGLGLLTCILGIAVAFPPTLVAIHNYYTAILRFDSSDPNHDAFYRLYIPTYNRACAYFVGVFLGYDVVNHKRHFHKAVVAICWIMVCVGFVVCVWITHLTHKTDYEYNKPLEIGSALILRPVWSIASAWVAYACTQGYGGPVTKFLSTPLFLPLGRISYCIYLVHFVIQFTKNAAVQIPDIYLPFQLFNEFVADLVLSIIVAFFVSLCFESPVVILEKLLRNRGRRTDEPAAVLKSKKDVEGEIENGTISAAT